MFWAELFTYTALVCQNLLERVFGAIIHTELSLYKNYPKKILTFGIFAWEQR